MQHSVSLPALASAPAAPGSAITNLIQRTPNRLLVGTKGADVLAGVKQPQQQQGRRGFMPPKPKKVGIGVSELLRPKNDDPRNGSWSRFSASKDPSYFAALDAAFAEAERMVLTGDNTRRKWKLGGGKMSLKAGQAIAQGKQLSAAWSGVVSSEALEELGEQRRGDKEAAFTHIYDQIVDEEAFLVADEVIMEEDMRARIMLELEEAEAKRVREAAEKERLEREAAARARLEAAAAERLAAAAEADRAAMKVMVEESCSAAAEASEAAARAKESIASANAAYTADVEAAAAKVQEAADKAAAARDAALEAEEMEDKLSVEQAHADAADAALRAASAHAEAQELASKEPPPPEKITKPTNTVFRGGEGSTLSAVMNPLGVPLGAWPKQDGVTTEQQVVAALMQERSLPRLYPVRKATEEEREQVMRCFDSKGFGLSGYIARAPTREGWINYREATVDPLDPLTRGCVRFFDATMAGGKPHLLPVFDRAELQDVLLAAEMRFERWEAGVFDALLNELISVKANLFSAHPGHDESGLSRAHAWRSLEHFGQNAPPLCPYLLLKRKVAVVHIIDSTDGTAELVQVENPTLGEGERSVGGAMWPGPVVYRRLSTPLVDGIKPAGAAVDLVGRTLGIPVASVRLLDTHPKVIRGSSDRCAYPGLGCEHTFYVVRVAIDKLPSHPFSTRRMQWTWVKAQERRPVKPEVTAWAPPREQPAADKLEVVRRSLAPPIIRATTTPSRRQLQSR